MTPQVVTEELVNIVEHNESPLVIADLVKKLVEDYKEATAITFDDDSDCPGGACKL
jgi:hypothetical protein